MMAIFHQYPDEAQVIGRLLAGYSELEILLMHCVMTVRDDFNVALKTMYRTRGEKQRIQIADAMARQPFHSIGCGTQFEMAIGSMSVV
jgi:hypothetical protein